MPTYNRRGDIAFGVDSVVGWVRRGQQPHVVATNAGGAVWIDDQTILYQANNAGAAPYLENSRGEMVDKRGANELAGGNGRWAAALLSTPSLVYTSGFGEAPGGGKISMSRQDGTLVYVAEFNPDSRGIVAVYPHGAVSSFDAVHVASTVCADERGIGWFHDGFWFEYVEAGVRTTIRLPYETYGGKMRRRPDGSLWIVYSSELAHHAICHSVTDPTHGFLFGTTDHAVNPDVIELDGVFYGCWSLTTGERPEHIKESTVTEWGALPRVPVVAPPTPAPSSAYARAWPRKVWSFSFASYQAKYGYTDDPVGSAVFVGREPGGDADVPADVRAAAAAGMPMVLGFTDLAGVPYDEVASQVIAWLAGGANIGGLSAAVDKCKALPRQLVLAYLDRRGWPSILPAAFDRQVVPLVQCYRQKNETLSEFDRSIRRDLEACLQWTPYVGVCLRFDDGFGGDNVWTVDEVLQSVPLYEAWSLDYPVMCQAFFSDRRGHGMQYHQALRAEAKRLVRQNPLRPSRYDYWFVGKVKAWLENKLWQDVEMMQFGPEEKAELRALVAGAPTPPEPEPPDPPSGEIPNHLDIVLAQAALTPLTRESTLEEIFKFTQRVAWTLRTTHDAIGDPPGMVGGLLSKPAGENIFTCAGETYSISRVCYPDGRIVKILTDAGPGGENGPSWNPEEPVDAARYRVATDPAGSCSPV